MPSNFFAGSGICILIEYPAILVFGKIDAVDPNQFKDIEQITATPMRGVAAQRVKLHGNQMGQPRQPNTHSMQIVFLSLCHHLGKSRFVDDHEIDRGKRTIDGIVHLKAASDLVLRVAECQYQRIPLSPVGFSHEQVDIAGLPGKAVGDDCISTDEQA